MSESTTINCKNYYNFKEDQGRNNLIKSFLGQELLHNIPDNKQVAEKFAACSKIEGYTYGEEIYRENQFSLDHLFFVLTGSCELYMHDNFVTEISEGKCFGEFPIVSTGVKYYATPYSNSNETCIAKVAEDKFREIAKEYPAIWENIAKMLASRLKLCSEEKYKMRTNPNPKIFIGCSTEGLDVAKEIQAQLYKNFEPIIWNEGPFMQLGESLLESLENAVNEFDFGVFIFTPTDDIVSGGLTKKIARDNVIFELGLFIGKLSRKRAFLVHPTNVDLKILSDFNGVIVASYDPNRTPLMSALGPACNTIEKSIKTFYLHKKNRKI